MDTSLSFANVLEWLNDPANWQGADGIIARLGQRVYYAVIAVVIAVVIAIPLSVWSSATPDVEWSSSPVWPMHYAPSRRSACSSIWWCSFHRRSTARASYRTYSRPRSSWYCLRFHRY